MATALILNSGLGSRMGGLTAGRPKCMTPLWDGETIASRCLRQLAARGVKRVVMTTGYCAQQLEDHCRSLQLPLDLTFVYNPRYQETNYIYSMYLAREALTGDILYLHGDLAFGDEVLEAVLGSRDSCVAVSRGAPLPEKDFKAVLRQGLVEKIGVEFFENAVAAQPLYKLQAADFQLWMAGIAALCEAGETGCYAEKALNAVTDRCKLIPVDIGAALCQEVDTPEDLEYIREKRG